MAGRPLSFSASPARQGLVRMSGRREAPCQCISDLSFVVTVHLFFLPLPLARRFRARCGGVRDTRGQPGRSKRRAAKMRKEMRLQSLERIVASFEFLILGRGIIGMSWDDVYQYR